MRKILTVAFTALAMTATVVNAATATATFTVTATVLKTCSVAAAPLAFGSYTPGTGAATGIAAISVKCTNGTPFVVALNGGVTTGGTISQRLLANGTNTLQYNLFTSSGFGTIWGDGTSGSTQSGTGSGLATANPLTVFGQLPDSAANQGAVTGPYTDTVTVTVSY